MYGVMEASPFGLITTHSQNVEKPSGLGSPAQAGPYRQLRLSGPSCLTAALRRRLKYLHQPHPGGRRIDSRAVPARAIRWPTPGNA